MNNYLVIGGNGQLGMCFRAVSFKFPNLNLYFADKALINLNKYSTLVNFYNKFNFDGIINCAAYTNVDKAENDFQNAFLTNYKALENLVLFCQIKNLKLVHFSTNYVFDGTSESPYTEEDIPNPINIYGKSKYKGEQVIRDSNCKHVIIRLSSLFSPYGKNFVKTLKDGCLSNKSFKIVNDEWINPTYGIDIAKVILEHLTNPIFFDYSIYNYVNKGDTNWFDFANQICKHLNIKCKINSCLSRDYKSPALRPQYGLLDTSRIENHLSLSIASWEDALKRSLNKTI